MSCVVVSYRTFIISRAHSHRSGGSVVARQWRQGGGAESDRAQKIEAWMYHAEMKNGTKGTNGKLSEVECVEIGVLRWEMMKSGFHLILYIPLIFLYFPTQNIISVLRIGKRIANHH